MYVATTSNEANAADGPFSTACPDLTRRRTGVGYSHVRGEVMGSEIERLTVPVRGMHCAACVGKVEGALKSVAGVSEALVNLATERATIRFDPTLADFPTFKKAVAESGYGVVEPTGGTEKTGGRG